MSTVTVLCKVEGGAVLELGRVRDNRGEWNKGPNYRSVRLAEGINRNVNGELVSEWLRLKRDTPAVQSGDLRIVSDDDATNHSAAPARNVWQMPVGGRS